MPALSLLAGVVAALSPADLSAQISRSPSIRIEASVDTTKASVGGTVALKVKITVSSPLSGGYIRGAYDRYEHPTMPDFDIVGHYSSESTQITFGSGGAAQITTQTITYQLRPRKSGRLVIGPAKVKVGSKSYSTKRIVVRAVKGAVPLTPPDPGSLTPSKIPTGDVFLQATANKKSCYVGEQITVSWDLYQDASASVMTFRPVTPPSTDDFFVEDLYTFGSGTKTTEKDIGGRVYYVTPLYRKALFARKTGTLKVGALEANLSTTTTRLYSLSPLLRRSPEIQIQVLPLPAQGKPNGFHSGNVGRFTVQASVDRTHVNAGDAVTLTVTVKGQGHPARIKLEELTNLPGFKVRSVKPQEKTTAGTVVTSTKTYEYVLIALAGGTHTIPSFKLDFFDPFDRAYKSARSTPINITVTGSLPSSPTAPAAVQGRVNIVHKKIKPIHRKARLSRATSERFYSSFAFKALALLPLLLLLSVLFWEVGRPRLFRDTEARRWRKAKGAARRRFRTARHKMEQKDASGFFSEVARVLLELLSQRLGIKAQGQTTEDLKAIMLQRGFTAEQTEEILKELETCDFARFSPAAAQVSEMDQTLHRARDLALVIEKARLSKNSSAVEPGGRS